MRYISDDNKVFNSEQECLAHEKGLNEERVKREKLIAEKSKRKEEVLKSYNDFSDLIKKYSDDYEEPLPIKDNLDALNLLNRLFPVRIW